MEAVVIALAVMMWMWMAAGLHLTRYLEKRGDYSVRMAYAAAIAAVGATLALLLAWMVLPGSQLSLGWTLKQLQHTRQLAAWLVLLTAAAALWRAHLLFRPVPGPGAALAVAARPAQKKRRP